MNADLLAVLRGYPQIYYACHVDHTRARSNPHGLSARDASILAHLSRSESVRASELARHLGVGASTLSAALATLEALGYLAREQDPSDRRVQRIRLAERGEIAMAESSVLVEDGEVASPVFRFFSRFVFGHYRTQETYLRLLAASFGEAATIQRMAEEPATSVGAASAAMLLADEKRHRG